VTSEAQRLAARRIQQGHTQETLAAVLGVERSTVERWENGRRRPRPGTRPALAAALGVSVDELDHMLAEPPHGSGPSPAASAPETIGLVAAPSADPRHGTSERRSSIEPVGDWLARSESGETEHMHRREALRLFSMFGALLALDPGEQEQVQPVDLSGHARLNHHLWQAFALAASKSDVLPMVRGHQQSLIEALAGPHRIGTRQELCALIADVYQLAGEIFFDRNDYTSAADCYTLAAEAGKDAAAFDLWACALTRHAFISMYEGAFSEAEPMLELAASLAKRGDPEMSTRHWVAAVQAEAYAGLGDLDACQRALDTAEEVTHLPGRVHNGGWLRFDGTRLAELRGTCYVTLSRPDLAEPALKLALRQNLSPRRRAGVLTDLALAGAQRRDPDQVLTHARAVVHDAHATGSGVMVSKLRGLQPRLRSMMDIPQINQLNKDINAVANHR
jgi:transcriptional regulator with XRE-family HTH domain